MKTALMTVGFLVLMYACEALGDIPSAALRAEIRSLETRIRLLERRVNALERVVNSQFSTQSKSRDFNSQWKALGIGMTKGNVISILGPPSKIEKGDYGETWYYPDAQGGVVNFDRSDHVKDWNEP